MKRVVGPAFVVAIIAVVGLGGRAQGARTDACPPLTFSPPDGTHFAAATVGQLYQQTVTASGSPTGRYFWQLKDYNVNSTGFSTDSFPNKGVGGSTFSISGTPTYPGTDYYFQVNLWAVDANGKTCDAPGGIPQSAEYKFDVNAKATPPPPPPSDEPLTHAFWWFKSMPFAAGELAGVRVALAGTKKAPANMKSFSLQGRTLFLPATSIGKALVKDLSELVKEVQTEQAHPNNPAWYQLNVDSIDDSVIDAIEHIDKAPSWSAEMGQLQIAQSDLGKAAATEEATIKKLERKPTPNLDAAEQELFKAIDYEKEADAVAAKRRQYDEYVAQSEAALKGADDRVGKAVAAGEGYLEPTSTAELHSWLKGAIQDDADARKYGDGSNSLVSSYYLKRQALGAIETARTGVKLAPPHS